MTHFHQSGSTQAQHPSDSATHGTERQRESVAAIPDPNRNAPKNGLQESYTALELQLTDDLCLAYMKNLALWFHFLCWYFHDTPTSSFKIFWYKPIIPYTLLRVEKEGLCFCLAVPLHMSRCRLFIVSVLLHGKTHMFSCRNSVFDYKISCIISVEIWCLSFFCSH